MIIGTWGLPPDHGTAEAPSDLARLTRLKTQHPVVWPRCSRLPLQSDPVTTIEPGAEPSPLDETRVAQRLYLAARHHVRAAQRLGGSIDLWDRMDAAYHAGSAVELIAKAVLARLDPRVLAKGPAAQHHLLDTLVERHGRLGHTPRTLRLDASTIDAAVAIDLVHRLVPECRPHRGAAEKARAIRNGAVHMAKWDDSVLDDIITGVLSYVTAALPAAHQRADDVWSEGLLAEVDRVTRARLDRIARVANMKVIHARERYKELSSVLSRETRDALVADLSGRFVGNVDYQERFDCPACALPYAWLQWFADFEAVRDGEDWGYEGGLVFSGLRCPVCTLDLDADEVASLGIDATPTREPEFGPGEDR